MEIDYRHIYQEFEKLSSAKEYEEYCSELTEINRLLRTVPFDSFCASQVCSHLSTKYEKEINQQPGKLGGKTVVKGNSLPKKTPVDLYEDLQYFKAHIPVFALMREVKSDVIKRMLGI